MEHYLRIRYLRLKSNEVFYSVFNNEKNISLLHCKNKGHITLFTVTRIRTTSSKRRRDKS